MGISAGLGSSALLPAGLGFRNILINGNMQIAQRGTSSASVSTSGYYTVDRWSWLENSQGTWTLTQATSSGDYPDGFRASFKAQCTTADSSPAAGDYVIVRQIVEGQNLQSFAKGTSSAKPFALSFWVKAFQTGTFICQLFDTTNTRSVSASYTINVSGTWERKTILFPADATGAFANDNTGALEVRWWLGAGSTFSSGTLQTSWGALVDANTAAGQTNVASSTNNYWQVTGIQLEQNYQPTPFEQRPVGIELSLCQRYYEKSYSQGTSPGTSTDTGFVMAMVGGAQASSSGIHDAYLYFKTEKRGSPTMVIYDLVGNSNKCRRTTVGVANYDNQSVQDITGYNNGCYFRSSSGSGSTNTISCHFTASAEL